MTVPISFDYEIAINERGDGAFEFFALTASGDLLFTAEITVEKIGAIANMATGVLVQKLARDSRARKREKQP